VRRRATRSPCAFTLLVPRDTHGLHRVVDPEDHGWWEAGETIAVARPVLEEAAGGRIEALIGSHDPLAAVQDALNLQGYDEVIISTLPPRVSRWLRLDLPHKVAALGVPVEHVQGRTLVAVRERDGEVYAAIRGRTRGPCRCRPCGSRASPGAPAASASGR
jgi:hypothetical protein